MLGPSISHPVKFNIAFENSSAPGYTTEKVMEAFAANTVPIYFGDPFVSKDFNPEAMVVVRSMEDVDRAIEEIKRLDADDDAYLKMCRAPCLAFKDPEKYDKEYDAFMSNIFAPEKKFARRLCPYGREPSLRQEYQAFYHSWQTDMLRLLKVKLHALIHCIKGIVR